MISDKVRRILWKAKTKGMRKSVLDQLSYLALYKNNPEWQILKKVLDNRLSASSAFWLAFTPIGAKALEQSQQLVEVFGIRVNLSLPFSWILLFFSSLLIFFARLVFFWKAPSVVKDYDSVSDLRTSGTTAMQYLLVAVHDINYGCKNTDPKHINGFIDEIVDANYETQLEISRSTGNPADLRPDKSNINYLGELLSGSSSKFAKTRARAEDNIANIFWYSQNLIGNAHNRGWRFVATLLFATGMLPLAFIILQSTAYVISAAF